MWSPVFRTPKPTNTLELPSLGGNHLCPDRDFLPQLLFAFVLPVLLQPYYPRFLQPPHDCIMTIAIMQEVEVQITLLRASM